MRGIKRSVGTWSEFDRGHLNLSKEYKQETEMNDVDVPLGLELIHLSRLAKQVSFSKD